MYNFPASPSPGDEYTPPVGGQTYIWQPPRWLVKGIPPAGGGGGGGVDEAPIDTKQYGRQDAAWTEVVANPTWTTLSGKPATFPPTVPIAQADVTNLTADLAAKVAKAGDTMTGALTVPTVNVGTTDGASAGSGIILRKRTSGFSETIAFSDGAGGLRAGINVLADGRMTFRVGDNTTDKVQFSTTGNITSVGLVSSAIIKSTVADSSQAMLLAGASKGVRFVPQTTGFTIEGVDQTGVGSYQPLTISGSTLALGTTTAAGVNVTTKLSTATPTATNAMFRLPHGTAPSAPVDGDLWTTLAGGVFARISGVTQNLAPLASPVFTGDPQAPTPATADNDTSIATTAYVKANIATLPGLTAQARNRIVNGAMQISQENGDTLWSGPYSALHIADQWINYYSTTGTMATQRVQVTTPNGSVNRIRLTIAAADTSLAAGEYFTWQQPIEGIHVADFRYGSASARQAVLRFGIKAPAGTYSVSLRNGTDNRSYLANFTISAGQANTDTVQTFVIPGDVTGTWATNTSAGMKLTVCFATGTTYQGVAGWQAGLFYGTASNTNGLATINAVFELFDVGLYLDPLATGIAPPWVMPDETEELRACQRYWMKFDNEIVDTSTAFQNFTYPVGMRSSPAITGGGAGFTVYQTMLTHHSVYQTSRTLQNIVANARM